MRLRGHAVGGCAPEGPMRFHDHPHARRHSVILSIALSLLLTTLFVLAPSPLPLLARPFAFSSTKTPYKPPVDSLFLSDASLFPHCELVHVNYLSRHGTRHSNKQKDAIAALAELQSRRDSLSALGVSVSQWLSEFIANETDKSGALSSAGARELLDAGRRFGSWLKSHAHRAVAAGKRVIFGSTHKARAVHSRDKFADGLYMSFGEQLFRQLNVNTSTFTCSNDVPSPHVNLRFFDSCMSYLDAKPDLSLLSQSMFQKSVPKDAMVTMTTVATQLLFQSPNEVEPQAAAKIVAGIYDTCLYEWSVYGKHDQLCTFFQNHTRLSAAMEFKSDLKAFVLKSTGHTISYGPSCVLLEDVFSACDAHTHAHTVDHSHSHAHRAHTFAELRFAHAETLWPLISLLHVYDSSPPHIDSYVNGGVRSHEHHHHKVPWIGSGSTIVPMGSNLAFYLYRCNDEQHSHHHHHTHDDNGGKHVYGSVGDDADGNGDGDDDGNWQLALTHNERVVRFPPCPNSDLCPYETVKRYYRTVVYPGAGVGNCSRDDWLRVCKAAKPCKPD